jgi:hypothetical protein
VADSLLSTAAVVACGAGAVGLRRLRPGPAALLLATAVLWVVGGVVGPLALAHRGPLTHLLLGHPHARLRGGVSRAVAGAAYVDGLVVFLGRSPRLTLALGGCVVGVAVSRWRGSRGGDRPARRAAALGALLLWGALGVGAMGGLAGWGIEPQVLGAYEGVIVVVALGLLGETYYARWSRRDATSLAIDLGRDPAPSLRDRLAVALGDPTLVLAVVEPSTGRAYDESGRPVFLAPTGPGRAVTTVRDGDRVIAELEHDTRVLQDAVLLTSVAALTRMAVTNSGLQRDVARRMAEVSESRRRLLVVADRERERLEAELHGGVLRELEGVGHLLASPAVGDGLAGDLAACQAAITDFARGVHPRRLSEAGLAAAVHDVAASAPLPVAVDISSCRYPPEVEAAAYFVCAEALTNTIRYAGATHVDVRAHEADGTLVVAVRDDGIGGASTSAGTGLMGLADRLDVLGGRLTLTSPAGHGTSVVAVIPCATGALSAGSPTPEVGTSG